MAWMRRRSAAIGGLAASVLVLACSEGEARTSVTPTTTGEDDTTGSITTFQPTSIDPTDPTLTTSGSEDETGTGTTGATSIEPDSDGGSTAGTSEGSSSGSVDEPPSVQSTTPAELMSGVAADTTIEVTFSEVMDPATVTTNVGTGCTGALQVSSDGFVTCVAMTSAPSTGDDQTFVVTPAEPLDSATTYQIRVLATVTDVGGTPMDADFTTVTGFIVRYFHTIDIDGTDDFNMDEILSLSTPGHTARVAWDDSYLYLGFDSPAVGGDPEEWMVVYIGGPAGTSQGVMYNTQLPTMPFDARWHLRWRLDGTFWGALEWTGAAWQDAAFTIPAADVIMMGSFVELRVPWADIGDPAYLDLHLGLLNEQDFGEWSWAAVPDTSYGDGYDPAYSHFLQFDRFGSTLPANVLPM